MIKYYFWRLLFRLTPAPWLVDWIDSEYPQKRKYRWGSYVLMKYGNTEYGEGYK